mgnify:CR=1 FL=1
MPRPRKNPALRHTSKVTVAVTDELKLEFEEACAAAGISPSEFVRRCLLQLIEEQSSRDGDGSITTPSESRAGIT